jgi:hypothetical protein
MRAFVLFVLGSLVVGACSAGGRPGTVGPAGGDDVDAAAEPDAEVRPSEGDAGGAAGQPEADAAGASGANDATIDDGAAVALDAGNLAADRAAPPGRGMSLFDGHTLTGWSGNPKIWSVKDGAIDGTATGGNGEIIFTDADYDSFRIILTARLVSMTQHLGVCFWGSRPKPGTWGYNGCLDVIPPQGALWDYSAGAIKGPTIGTGTADMNTWHQTEILANLQTGTIQVAVNGVLVTDYKETNLGKRKKGPIGLQIHAHASEVQYKDISIEVAPADDHLVTLK